MRLADRMVEMSNRSDPDWDQLRVIITDLWDALETYLEYDILSTSQSEILNMPRTDRTVTLTHPNVTAVSFVGASTANGLRVQYTGSDTNARVEVTDSALTLTSRAGSTTTSNSLTFAANVTTTAMASAVTAVSGWSGTVLEAWPSAYLVKQGVRDAKSREVTLEVWEDYEGDYTVEYTEGLVTFETFPPWGFNGQLRMDYTAGLSAIPNDLELWLIQNSLMKYDQAPHDGSLKSERLGDYSYDRGTGGVALTETASFQRSTVLQRYRRLRP
jgi:hypothetical protein